MKNLFRVVLLLGAIGLGVWGWLILFPSPQVVIENRLKKLAGLASFGAGEGNVAKLANVQRLGTYFTDNIEVKLEGTGLESHTFNKREELMQAAMAARSSGLEIHAKFIDVKVTLSPAGDSAEADLMLNLSVSTLRDPIFQEMKVRLQKEGSTWLVNRIETTSTLKN